MGAAEGAAVHFSLVDALTILVAIVVVFVKMWLRWKRGEPVATVTTCGSDFLNGTVIVPFVVMGLAVFSDSMFKEMTHASTAFISIAGVIGFLFVCGELLRPTKAGHA